MAKIKAQKKVKKVIKPIKAVKPVAPVKAVDAETSKEGQVMNRTKKINTYGMKYLKGK